MIIFIILATYFLIRFLYFTVFPLILIGVKSFGPVSFFSIISQAQPSVFYLIIIPLIGVFVILFTKNIKEWPAVQHPKEKVKENSDTVLYNIALFFSLLNLLVSVVMWYFFNNTTSETRVESGDIALLTNIEIDTQFQFIFEINQFSFGVDGISIFFVLLTTFITPIAIFSSYELYESSKSNIAVVPSYGHNEKSATLTEKSATLTALPLLVRSREELSPNVKLKIFLISLLLLESLQICAFVSLDLLLFYIFFESAKWFGISLLCLQLPNSGDTLKLIVPSRSRKTMCGWTNYSCKVTNYEMKWKLNGLSRI